MHRVIQKGVVGLSFLLVVLFGIVVVKTLSTSSKQIPVTRKIEFPIDAEAAVQRLSKALQIPTISNVSPVDYAQFRRFRDFLEDAFPRTHATLEREIINRYSLVYHWPGSSPQQKPILLLAHYDVFDVVKEEAWRYAPFSGTVAEGYVWGRGAIDDKSSSLALFEAIEHLIASGFQPTRTIYVALGHDEEGGGREGAAKEAEYFQSQGLKFEMVLDEGMITTQAVMPGLPASQWIALVGTEEKGFLNLKLTAEAVGGHSSMPPRQTSIGIVAQAIARIQDNPFAGRWTQATKDLLDTLGPETAFPYNLILTNRWLFGPFLLKLFASNPKTDSQIRTTIAPDVFNAGDQPASVPVTASAIINFRILPGETMQGVTDHVRKVIADPRVRIEPLTEGEGVWDAPPVSTAATDSFGVLNRTLREVMPDVLVSPVMMTGASDGRYFAARGLTRNWYRILPAKIKIEDIAGVHGINERLPVSSYLDTIHFYIQLMHNFSEAMR